MLALNSGRQATIPLPVGSIFFRLRRRPAGRRRTGSAPRTPGRRPWPGCRCRRASAAGGSPCRVPGSRTAGGPCRRSPCATATARMGPSPGRSAPCAASVRARHGAGGRVAGAAQDVHPARRGGRQRHALAGGGEGRLRGGGPGARVPVVHEGLNPAITEFARGLDPAAAARTEALSDQEPGGTVQVSADVDDSRARGPNRTSGTGWSAAPGFPRGRTRRARRRAPGPCPGLRPLPRGPPAAVARRVHARVPGERLPHRAGPRDPAGPGRRRRHGGRGRAVDPRGARPGPRARPAPPRGAVSRRPRRGGPAAGRGTRAGRPPAAGGRPRECTTGRGRSRGTQRGSPSPAATPW